MDVARVGDLVLLVSKDYKQYLITLRAGARMQTHRGIIQHDRVSRSSPDADHPLDRQRKNTRFLAKAHDDLQLG